MGKYYKLSVAEVLAKQIKSEIVKFKVVFKELEDADASSEKLDDMCKEALAVKADKKTLHAKGRIVRKAKFLQAECIKKHTKIYEELKNSVEQSEKLIEGYKDLENIFEHPEAHIELKNSANKLKSLVDDVKNSVLPTLNSDIAKAKVTQQKLLNQFNKLPKRLKSKYLHSFKQERDELNK